MEYRVMIAFKDDPRIQSPIFAYVTPEAHEKLVAAWINAPPTLGEPIYYGLPTSNGGAVLIDLMQVLVIHSEPNK